MDPTEEGSAAPAMEMPRYKSHKKVWALEIKSISHNADGGSILSFRDLGYADLIVPASSDLFTRYKPVPGDFYVEYSDGYKSLSPRKAFLEGYTRVEPNFGENFPAPKRRHFRLG